MDIFDYVDAILIKNSTMPFLDENFFYFTGMEGMEESIAIIMPGGVEIIAPLLERREGITVYDSMRKRDELLQEILKNKRVGINGKALTYHDYNHFKKMFNLIDVGKEIEMMRAIKREDEIRKIRKAVKITKNAIRNIDFYDRKEVEVAGEIKCYFARNGAEESFKSIVAFGKNTSFPHHNPGKKNFVYPVLIDTGAKYRGYCSDITRTFMKRKSRKYEIIEEALFMAIDRMETGVKANEIYTHISDFLKRHKIKMIHSLGHSIGIKVHDGLSINKKADFVIEENMVFAIEPAGYFKRYGIRIEEDVVIRGGRARII